MALPSRGAVAASTHEVATVTTVQICIVFILRSHFRRVAATGLARLTHVHGLAPGRVVADRLKENERRGQTRGGGMETDGI